MKVLKVINNNVVSAYNERGEEVIVTGKGLGFQKKPKDEIEKDKIEKIFRLDDTNTRRFEEMLADIPYDYVQLVIRIVEQAKELTGQKLNKSIYISLLDHINYAIQRMQSGIRIENSLLLEIKRFYNTEYQIGLMATYMIRKELNIVFPEDEAGFIAMHILNAELGNTIKNTSMIPDILKDIYNIVSYSAKHKIDNESIYYERFVTHMKFLVERISKGIDYNNDDRTLYEMVRQQYPESFRCALQIQTYLNRRIQYQLPEEELAYLTIHIENILKYE